MVIAATAPSRRRCGSCRSCGCIPVGHLAAATYKALRRAIATSRRLRARIRRGSTDARRHRQDARSRVTRPAARISRSISRCSRRRAWSCASIARSTRTPSCIRWCAGSSRAGCRRTQRRAFLFTNVTDGAGRKYDMPVVVGALAASPRIYSVGMGRPVEEIEAAWTNAIANPIPPVRVDVAAVPGGRHHGRRAARARQGPRRAAGADLDAGLRRRALSHRDACGHARSRDAASRTWAPIAPASKPPTGSACAWRRASAAPAAISTGASTTSCKTPMPCAFVIGAAPVVMFTGPMKLPIDLDEMAVAGGLAGAPIRIAKCVTVDLDVPADAEIVIEGLIDPELLEPEGPFGESHGHVALEDFNMSMQVTAITRKRTPVFVSIISEVTPSESSVVKKVAYEPMFLSHLRDQLSIKGVRRVVMHEPLTNLRKVIFVQCRARHAAHGSVARAARRLDAARRLRQDLHRGERGHRSRPTPTRCSGRSPIAPTRSTTCTSCPIARPATGRSPARTARNSTLLIDATLKHAGAAARAAGARVHGARARHLGGAEAAGAHPAAALARLFARRLGGRLGDLRAPRGARASGRRTAATPSRAAAAACTPETPVREVEGKK